jgi:hypothetical protein
MKPQPVRILDAPNSAVSPATLEIRFFTVWEGSTTRPAPLVFMNISLHSSGLGSAMCNQNQRQADPSSDLVVKYLVLCQSQDFLHGDPGCSVITPLCRSTVCCGTGRDLVCAKLMMPDKVRVMSDTVQRSLGFCRKPYK